LPEKAEGFTKRSYPEGHDTSALLRCKQHRSMYTRIRLTVRFLRALHLNIFEQPPNNTIFNQGAIFVGVIVSFLNVFL